MATPSPTPTAISQVVENYLHPGNGNGTIADEISCYGLPYGGLGVLSHALTYYTACCTIVGFAPVKWWEKDPLKEWKWVKLHHHHWNTGQSIISLLITIPTAATTIHSCRNSWPLVLMAVWKLLLSISINATGLIRAFFTFHENRKKKLLGQEHTVELGEESNTSGLRHAAEPPGDARSTRDEQNHHRDDDEDDADDDDSLRGCVVEAIQAAIEYAVEKWIKPQVKAWKKLVKMLLKDIATGLGMSFYILGIPVGIVGLFAIVHLTLWANKDVQILTGVLGAAIVSFISIAAYGLHRKVKNVGWAIPVALAVLAAIVITFTFFVFYSDLVLAAVTGHWLGVPSGAQKNIQVAYWFYYFGKRLPMLSA